MEEPEIATVGAKGQVVIPQQLRKELGIRSKTKLAIFSKGGKLVATKIEAPAVEDELDDLFREIDSRSKGKRKPTEREILEEIQGYRAEKRSTQGA